VLERLGMSEAEFDEIDARVDAQVAEAVAAAEASSEPDVSELAAGMYAGGSAQQFARMLPGSPFGERELVFAGGLGE
jgi:TPP-dependent pyruvate/acetoin dehydrogenase alpha subunit